MPSVAIHGGIVHVDAAPGVVVLSNGSMTNGHVLPVAAARELVGLLDAVLADDASPGMVGSVAMTNGRLLFLKVWPTAVTIAVERDQHSGWTFRMKDQIEGLRDAIAEASRAG
jgi:hypothetical protein